MEKIEIVKWFTSLTPQKRIVAYSVAIIGTLALLVYGLTNYIEKSIERDREERRADYNRLLIERDNLQIKLEVAQDKYLKYVEKQIQRYEELSNKTEELKRVVNENN